MLFLVPHLFPSARLLEAAVQDLHLPALQTLLARGIRQICPAEGVEAALCEAMGIARQQDWPVAPITLEADGGVAGDAYWLRADPVHLRVMRDRIMLADNSALNLSRQEADALATTISQHFGADLSPLPLHSQRWYLQRPSAPQLTTTPLSIATGRNIDPLLPHGADAMQFRMQLNELQMLLHEHPVNQMRESRGELPVNSLWLWGGGNKPAVPTACMPIYARDPMAQALARFCGTRTHPLPSHVEPSLLAKVGVLVLDDLTAAAECGDAYGWRQALEMLEQDWFVPLRRALRALGPHGLHLLDPVNGKALYLQRTDAWKIWRRPQSLVLSLA